MESKNITKEEKTRLDKSRKWSWKYFPITKASFPTNLFLTSKLSIKNFTWRSSNDYGIQSYENDLKNGQQTIDVFYTTMLHHIELWLLKSTFPDKALPLWSTLFITDFYQFPLLKTKLKGHRFVNSDEVIEMVQSNWN